MAPEIHLDIGYEGEEIDVFAAGVCLFVMLAKQMPFEKARASD